MYTVEVANNSKSEMYVVTNGEPSMFGDNHAMKPFVGLIALICSLRLQYNVPCAKMTSPHCVSPIAVV